MSGKKTLNLDKYKGWQMMPVKISIGVLLVLLIISINAFGQGNDGPFDQFYTVALRNFNGLSGDTVRMPIAIKNPRPLSGFLLRIEYDTTMLEPITYQIWDENEGGFVDQTLIPLYDSLEMIGPGLETVVVDSIDVCDGGTNVDTIYTVYATHDPTDDSMHTNSMFVQFLPILPPANSDLYPDCWNEPVIPASPGLTDVMQLLWMVKPNQTLNATSEVRLYDYRQVNELVDPPPDYRDNQLTDTSGVAYFPTRVDATFTVSDATSFDCTQCVFPYECNEAQTECVLIQGGDNDPPVVSDISPSNFVITQGEGIPDITVNASDPNGDFLSLTATGLPEGATFSPVNPVTGTGAVSGTFSWTSTLSTNPGTYVINFQATDSEGANSTIQSVVITVEALDIDRLYSTSAYGGSPVGGLPGAGPFSFPIDLITSKTVYGIQFEMAYDGDIFDLDSFAVTSRTPEYVVYENIGVVPDSVRVITFGLANEVIGDPDQVDGNSILKAFVTIDSSALAGDYWFHIYDAWESVDPDPEVPSLALLTDSGIVQVDVLGDVNLDKMINVADMVNIVGYIIGNYGLPERNFETADVITDDEVTVVDLVGVVNLAFDRPIDPSPSPGEGTDFATVSLNRGSLMEGQYSKLQVSGELPEDIAGVQLDVEYDPTMITMDNPELPEGSSGITISYKDDKQGRMKMVIYSHQPWNPRALIKSGSASIVNLPVTAKQNVAADDYSSIRINKVHMTNASAGEVHVEESDNPVVPASFTLHQNYPNPFNPTTTIEFEIGAGGSARQAVELTVFNILGQKVKTLVDEELRSGYHAVKWDGKSDNNKPVATGVYLYRLKIDEQHQTKKMVLLK